jgi:hypothetical protein
VDEVAGILTDHQASAQGIEEAVDPLVVGDLDDAAADLSQRVRIGAGAPGKVPGLGPAARFFVELGLVDAGVEDLDHVDVRLDGGQHLFAEALAAGERVGDVDREVSTAGVPLGIFSERKSPVTSTPSAVFTSSPTMTRSGARSRTLKAPSISLWSVIAMRCRSRARAALTTSA